MFSYHAESAGINQIKLETENIKNGSYICRLINSEGSSGICFQILK
jgi:hypothetical protein